MERVPRYVALEAGKVQATAPRAWRLFGLDGPGGSGNYHNRWQAASIRAAMTREGVSIASSPRRSS
jgi:hypothetical protein